MMRILHITQSFLPSIGGMEWVVHHLSNALVERGHDVHVLHSHPPHLPPADLAPFNPHYVPHPYPFGFRGGEVLGRNLRCMVRHIRRLLRETPYDLVHAHMLHYPGTAALAACESQHVPVIVTEHGQYVISMRPGADHTTHRGRHALRKTLSTVEYLTSPGGENLEMLLRDRATLPRRATVLPNGLHLPSEEAMRRLRVAVPIEPQRILMVARWHPVKQLEHGVQAFAHLVSGGSGVPVRAHLRLTIVGSGVRDHLQPLADQLGVGSAVDFIEASGEALWSQYAQHRIFWMTSSRESMGLTKYEAMAFGLACVVNDTPGCREAVVDGHTGLLYDANQPESLAVQTARLLGDPALQARLAAAGPAVAAPLRWENLVTRYEDEYRAVIAADRAPQG